MICTVPKIHDQGVGISWVWIQVEWKVPRVLPMQLPNNSGSMSEIAHVRSSVYTTKKQFQGLRKCKFERKDWLTCLTLSDEILEHGILTVT